MHPLADVFPYMSCCKGLNKSIVGASTFLLHWYAVNGSIASVRHLENCGLRKHVQVGGRSSECTPLALQLLSLESIEWEAEMGWLIFRHWKQQAREFLGLCASTDF